MSDAVVFTGAEVSDRTRMRRHQWLYNLGRAVRTPRGAVGLSLVVIVVLVAVIGPFVVPYSSTNFVTLPFAQPSKAYLLGGDILGRDVLSRLLDGGWELLLMALAATAFGVIVGGIAGVSAAYLRGRADGLIMRTVDVILAFPQLVFALLLVSIIGPKVWLIVLAVGISHAPQVARVLRSATLDISERDFVKAIELEGVSPARVMARDPAEPRDPAHGGDGAPPDVLDRHHGRPELPRVRHPAAGAQLGTDDQRESHRAGVEPLGRGRSCGADRDVDRWHEYLH